MDTTSATQLYAKRFIPLESDPPALNDLMYGLGVSSRFMFTDVWTVDDPVQLSTMSRPAYALILVLPACEAYERHRQAGRDSGKTTEDLEREKIIWMRQTIDMACGLYAVLHATSNSATSNFISTWILAIEDSCADYVCLTSPRFIPQQTRDLVGYQARGSTRRLERS